MGINKQVNKQFGFYASYLSKENIKDLNIKGLYRQKAIKVIIGTR